MVQWTKEHTKVIRMQEALNKQIPTEPITEQQLNDILREAKKLKWREPAKG